MSAAPAASGDGTARPSRGGERRERGEGEGRGDGNRQRGNRGGRGRGRGGRGGGGGRGGNGAEAQGPREGGERRRGSGRRGGQGGGAAAATAAAAVDSEADKEAARGDGGKDARLRPAEPPGAADDEAEVCFICANTVIHHSIAPCNHITCHICALRMRALYRNKDCPHCRTPAPYVIFTDDPSRRYEDYGSGDISSTDEQIGIKYANEEIVGDTVLLLRYNCPEETCDYAGLGWADLHRHVRDVHHKKMCDLCTRNKKVFTHEHELFSDRALERHMRHGDDRPGAVDQTGFKGHPLCSFCGERFYDDDRLYEHCRNKHERCFVCDRRDARQPHYYRNYDALEAHFLRDHFLCMDRECLDKKFVVFGSELDLKAHQLSEHGNTLSKDVRRDVQVVSMSDFDYRPGYNGGGRGRDNHEQPMRRDELAYQRQLAVHSAASMAPRTFGTRLSRPAATPPAPAPAASPSPAAAASVDPLQALSPAEIAHLSPQERARRVRHGAVLERAANLLGNDARKLTAFRAQLASFHSGQTSALQLVDGFGTLFADTSPTALASLVREVADLYEDASKSDALRQAWQNRRARQDEDAAYPSLPTLGGMHGATTATSGWAATASASPGGSTLAASADVRHSTRVLRLKHSTRPGAAGVSAPAAPASTGAAGRSVPGATWTVPSRPAVGTASSGTSSGATPSAAFPALPSSKARAKGKAGGVQPSWIGASTGPSSSSSSSAPAPATTAVPVRAPPRRLPGEDAFPALPAAPKPLSTIFGYGRGAVRRDVGVRDTGFTWGEGDAEAGDVVAEEGEEEVGKGKKKGRKKVLVQWG